MIDKDMGGKKDQEKEKIRKRIRVAVDRDNYEYYPGEKQTDFYDHDTPQRVAVYVRVSTDDIRQTTSYELQKKYYEDFVVRHPNWVLVKIYADEGISGTSMAHRDAFQQMIRDCKGGMIEILLLIWIQSHDSLENEPPFEYPLNPLFINRYKHKKRSEPLTFISMPGAFSVLNNSFPLLSFGPGSASCSSSIGSLINRKSILIPRL